MIRSSAKLIIWIVEMYGELIKTWLKYAVNKVFEHDVYQTCSAETLQQGKERVNA